MLAIPEPPIASASIGLRLLSSDLNRATIQALGKGSMSISDLCAHLMLESDTTLREQLDQLQGCGAVELNDESRLHPSEYRLTRSGDGLLELMARAGAWLTCRPGRSLRPESDLAWRAVTALGDGWELSVLQHLLLRPSTRPELLTTIPALSRSKAKRMLRRLEGAGLLRLLHRDDQAPCYALGEWGRRSLAVLVAVAHWEREHLRGTAEPVSAIDGTIALLASLPLIRPRGDIAGICSFTVEGEAGTGPRSSAVWVRLEDGRMTACRTDTPPEPPDAWVHGGVDCWLDAVIHGRPTALQLGGDRALAKWVLRGLHDELFGSSIALL